MPLSIPNCLAANLGFSSDIDSMIREAGLISLRDKRDHINSKDLSDAYDRILYGAKNNTILSPVEKNGSRIMKPGTPSLDICSIQRMM